MFIISTVLLKNQNNFFLKKTNIKMINISQTEKFVYGVVPERIMMYIFQPDPIWQLHV